MNELCSEYKQAKNDNKLKLHSTKMKNCKIIDDVLFRKRLLWVLENMHMKLLQEVHDQSFISHLNNKWDIIYKIDDQIWLSFRNVKIMKSCKNLKDKQLDFYSIIVKVETFYDLHLSTSIKHIHLMFSSKLLQLYSENSLSEQHSKSLRSITIENDEHWKIDDILNFRRYQGWIQYKVKWKDLNKDNEWYYVDKEKFNDSKKVLNEFHKLYSSKSR